MTLTIELRTDANAMQCSAVPVKCQSSARAGEALRWRTQSAKTKLFCTSIEICFSIESYVQTERHFTDSSDSHDIWSAEVNISWMSRQGCIGVLISNVSHLQSHRMASIAMAVLFVPNETPTDAYRWRSGLKPVIRFSPPDLTAGDHCTRLTGPHTASHG